jgi:hypothetical protein
MPLLVQHDFANGNVEIELHNCVSETPAVKTQNHAI